MTDQSTPPPTGPHRRSRQLQDRWLGQPTNQPSDPASAQQAQELAHPPANPLGQHAYPPMPGQPSVGAPGYPSPSQPAALHPQASYPPGSYPPASNSPSAHPPASNPPGTYPAVAGPGADQTATQQPNQAAFDQHQAMQPPTYHAPPAQPPQAGVAQPTMGQPPSSNASPSTLAAQLSTPPTPQPVAPQTAAPQVTAPQVTAPQVTAPQVTAPQVTAPQVAPLPTLNPDQPSGHFPVQQPGFVEPGSQQAQAELITDVRPQAPHLDPRVAGLENTPKRGWWASRKALPLDNPDAPDLTVAFPTPRRIAVVGLKGGVGKTTSSILIARNIARARQQPTLLMDSDTTYGSLLLRLGVAPVASAHDLARMGDPGSLDILNGVISKTDDGVWVVPTGRDPAQSAAFGESTYVDAVRALYRYFSVSVTDCGTGLGGSLMDRVVTANHSLVIATSASMDGVLSAHNALQWLAATSHHGITARTIVVVGNVPDQPAINIADARDRLRGLCQSVVSIPADPHIATGGRIDIDQLQPETINAGRTLAALALHAAAQAP